MPRIINEAGLMPSNAFVQKIDRLTGLISNRPADMVRLVDQEVFELSQLGEPSAAKFLLPLLDDGCPHHECMFSILHAAEAAPLDAYVADLLAVFPAIAASNPEWASIILLRVLNSDPAREIIVGALRKSDKPTQAAVACIARQINERSPEFMGKTMDVLLSART